MLVNLISFSVCHMHDVCACAFAVCMHDDCLIITVITY